MPPEDVSPEMVQDDCEVYSALPIKNCDFVCSLVGSEMYE